MSGEIIADSLVHPVLASAFRKKSKVSMHEIVPQFVSHLKSIQRFVPRRLIKITILRE